MRAIVMQAVQQPLTIEQRDDLQPQANEVVVQLHAAALNRRDWWITQGKYAGIKTPIVLGSDGVGVVKTRGGRVDDQSNDVWGDAEVIINPGWGWGENQFTQSGDFQILGLPHDGTLAEQVVVPAQYVHPKPKHLSTDQAAALPLAGVTAYRAMFVRGNLQPREKVLVTGVGGGVATFAVQFAAAVGAEVFVTSSAPEKIAEARNLGATIGYNYTQTDWQKQLLADAGPMDLIIDGAGGAGYANLLDAAAPAGRIVNYGGTAGVPEGLDIRKVFWKQLNLLGSTMGSPADFQSMLEFVSQHKIAPVIDEVFPFDQANRAFEKMNHSGQFGKLVIRCDG